MRRMKSFRGNRTEARVINPMNHTANQSQSRELPVENRMRDQTQAQPVGHQAENCPQAPRTCVEPVADAKPGQYGSQRISEPESRNRPRAYSAHGRRKKAVPGRETKSKENRNGENRSEPGKARAKRLRERLRPLSPESQRTGQIGRAACRARV